MATPRSLSASQSACDPAMDARERKRTFLSSRGSFRVFKKEHMSTNIDSQFFSARRRDFLSFRMFGLIRSIAANEKQMQTMSEEKKCENQMECVTTRAQP